MALKYKEILNDWNNKMSRDFNIEELGLIEKIESYIDFEIKKDFGDNKEISIELPIPTFKYDPILKKSITNIPQPRISLMNKELERRYKDAGWKIRIEYDDGLDGPNLSGPDYWILKGKTK